jgi:SWI/SNF-related matrix-associated actin-dependent regulator of chromatin subfamily A-like protein 1
MIPFPHQIEGAKWLQGRAFGILADEPRVGKTGAAIMAADATGAKNILVVTTASGRGVWRKGFDDWSIMGRPQQILTSKSLLGSRVQVVIVGWPSITLAPVRAQLLAREWDGLILDEGHYAKSFEAARTQAVFGVPMDDALALASRSALVSKAKRVWHLTGTPMPNSPFDLYPVLRACAPGVLLAKGARPDVTKQADFKKRYCKVKPKKIGTGYYARWIDVIVDGQNLDELRARTEGLILRRTQADVGIQPPIYETLPLVITAQQRRRIEAEAGDARAIMQAVERGDTKALEMHLGPDRSGLLAQGSRAEADRGAGWVRRGRD